VDHPATNSEYYKPNVSALGAFHFLLFVDKRSYPKETIKDLQNYIGQIKKDYYCELEIIDLKDQPHLVEYYKLIVTPALVKLYPHPEQILVGSNLIKQLEKWLPQWQNELEAQKQQCLYFDPREDYNTISSRSNSNLISVTSSTELLRLSDEIFLLKQEKQFLLEKLRFKDQILAMVAHDLRNPLTAVSIVIDTLIHSQNLDLKGNNCKPLTPELKNRLYQQAQFQLKLMNNMIGDLLQATLNVHGKLTINPQALDLRSLGEEIINQLTPKLKAKSQKLKTDIPQDLPLVYADENLIRQVILNLLENALKYTDEGGKINFCILHRTSQKIQVTVKDTGLGIPPEKQEEIFEHNVRLERDLTKEGYGIGLSLCRKVIQAHYGSIWVDSVINKGSSFHFTLPIYLE
jgi:two-component system, OmpR family, clock-associated histidine kinase SasA